MSKILMFSHVPVIPKGKTFGPAMRTWGIAKSLHKKGHDVTISVKGQKNKEIFEDIKIIPENQVDLKNIKEYDVAYVHPWLNDKDFLKELSQIPIIVDVYAPFLIEHIYYDYDLKKDGAYRFADDIWFSTLAPFQYGDYFICASERQRKYYLGMLAACGRLNPKNKNRNMVGVVPFGINKEKPKGNKKILRKKIPKNKKIILWMSAFYNWLDPVKAAKILNELNKLSKDYALAVVGAKSPFVHHTMYDKNYNEFEKYVEKNNVENIYMFDWIDSEDIASVYNESALFIVTYKEKSLETDLSYRVRMMDALWGRLPVISESGDVVSEIIKKNNLGLIFDNKSPKEIAKKIASLSDKDISDIKKNINEFIPGYYWDNLIKPIDDFCKKPTKDNSKEMFKFSRFLSDRRDLTLQLRKENDEKERFLKELNQNLKIKEKYIDFAETSLKRTKNELDQLNKLILEKDNELNLQILKIHNMNKIIEHKDNELNLQILKIHSMHDTIQQKNNEHTKLINEKIRLIEEKEKNIMLLNSLLDETKHNLVRSNKELNKANIRIEDLKGILGKFRNSIVYPFYKITSNIGKTKIGQILQKLLK